MTIRVSDTKTFILFSLFDKKSTKQLNEMLNEKNRQVKELTCEQEISDIHLEINVLNKMIERRERSESYEYA